MGIFSGLTMAGIITSSYLFCDSIPLDYIRKYEGCGNYNWQEYMRISRNQFAYSMPVGMAFTEIVDQTSNRLGKTAGTLFPAILAGLTTYFWHKYVGTENPIQPASISGTISIGGCLYIANRDKIKEKLEDLIR